MKRVPRAAFIGSLVGSGLVLLPLVACLLLAVPTGFVSRPERWDLPADYRGWVVLRYEDPSCPPLRADGLNRVIPFDAAGRACTSGRMARGWIYTEHQYVAPGGARTAVPEGEWGRPGVQVWAEITSSDYTEEAAFVGTEEQLNTNWASRPDLARPNPMK